MNFTGTGGTAVRDFVAASTSDDLVTFIVVRDTPQPDGSNTYIHYMGSKEGTQANVMLTLNPVPEPSAAVLLLAIVGSRLLRRRR